jgi:transmembrane sensor
MSIHRFKYLFQQFVNRKATPGEKDEFSSMLRSYDYDTEVQILLDELWENPSALNNMEADKAEWIFREIIASPNSVRKTKIFTIKRSLVGVAASFLLITGMSLLFYKQQSSPLIPVKSYVKNIQTVRPDIPARRFINLPDGSSVILNVDGKLEFDKDFTNGNREVTLTGEAYFDIVHDTKHPFIVHTGKFRTTVLGTAFNIKASPGNETVIVTVRRGKVKVGDSINTYNIIDPDQQVVFKSEAVTHIKKSVESHAFIAWTAGDIYFDDVSMRDVANQLQERFNVSIAFSNDLIKHCRFSATFLKGQSLAQILNIIGEFNQVKYHFQNKNSIILDGTGC